MDAHRPGPFAGSGLVANVGRGEGCDVYVGRPHPRYPGGSPWANPYRIGPDGRRLQVLARQRAWLLERPELLSRLPRLAGKRLGCWCSPLPC